MEEDRVKRRTRGLPPVPMRPPELAPDMLPPKGAYVARDPRVKGTVLRHAWPDRNKYKPHLGAKQGGKGSKE